MGIVVSLILIAVGAILTWAITNEPEGINIDAVGVILMIVGLVSFLLTLMFWSSWWGPGYWRRGGYVEGAPRARYARGRRATYVEEEVAPRATYVEEEVVPPAPGPPGPPPP